MGGGEGVREHDYYEELDDEAIHIGSDVYARAVDEAGAAVKYWSSDEGSGWWIIWCSLSDDQEQYVEMMLALAMHDQTPAWWLTEVIPRLLAWEPGQYDDLVIDPVTKLRLAARLAEVRK
jgi:hypothetical protein